MIWVKTVASLGFLPCRNSLFVGVENTDMALLVFGVDVGPPPPPQGKDANASRLVGPAQFRVSSVFFETSEPQIVDAVVGPIAINVVDVLFRPIAVM